MKYKVFRRLRTGDKGVVLVLQASFTRKAGVEKAF